MLVAVVVSIARGRRRFELEQHGVKLVGMLPAGFPPLTVPHVTAPTSPLLPGRVRHRARLARRHDRDSVGVRRPQRVRRSTATRRWSGSAPPTSPPGSSRASPSARAARERPSPSRRAPRRRSPGSSARSRSRHAPVRPGSAARPPAADARRSGDRGVALARRHPRARPALAAAPDRVRALASRPSSALPSSACFRAS